ncbi:MAG: glycosyltransferase family 39 protein [Bacteroidales bacterium]|nr:glycosyltransferase family 39 protein [Bacteroidales bacterium]MCF8338648.1 glycosyltransferase family 39 protein [Bacteroidales bacterium]
MLNYLRDAKESLNRKDNRLSLYLFFFVVLLVLLYFPYFSHLETLPMRVWDEAKRGVIAYEMAQTSNPLVTTYQGEPDFITTKPPFLIWIQAIFIKVLGMRELAVRLPVAIMALLTSLALFYYIRRYTGRYWPGWIAALLLVTVQGYVSMHGSRSGDFDVPVTFFMVLYAFNFLFFLETNRLKFLYLTCLFIILAVLTKGIIGFTFLPALLIFTVMRRQLLSLLSNRHFYYGLISVIVAVAGYYGLREFYTPGYLEAVANNELGGRFLEAQWSHSGGFWFYFEALHKEQFSYWFLLILPGMLIGLFYNDRKIRTINILAVLIIITYFLVISISKTKIEWYSIPMFPFLSIITGTAVYFVFELLRDFSFSRKLPLRKNVLPFIWLFLVFVAPYSEIIDKTFLPEDTGKAKNYYHPEVFLKEKTGKTFNPDGYTVVKEDKWHRFLFYIYKLRDQGYAVHVAEKENLKKGNKVIVLLPQTQKYIRKNYKYELIKKWKEVKRYRIKSQK